MESAGTKPSNVRPEAIAVMKELGIDISAQRSKHVAEFDGHRFDYVVTVSATTRKKAVRCSSERLSLHHSFNDPAAVEGTDERRLGAFRKVRDELRAYLKRFPQND